MKCLKFNHIEIENIKKGAQTATLRIKDDKDLTVDDVICIIDKTKEDDPTSWKRIGEAIIEKVTIQRLGDLDIENGNFEKFGSTSEMYEQMALFYGDIVEDNVHVKVIEFKFEPYEYPKKFEISDVNISTNISEIKLYGDGGSRGNPGPSASGYVLLDMQNNVIETNGEFLNITTNNQAEYHSLRLGLERAKQLGVKKVHVFMDSMLVINQMKGIYKVKNKELLGAFKIIQEIIKSFDFIEFTHVPRELNKLADAEVNRILDSQAGMV